VIIKDISTHMNCFQPIQSTFTSRSAKGDIVSRAVTP
jgi:hypothetical protein